MDSVNVSRRGFLVRAGLLAAVPFLASGMIGTARAQELKPLPPDNATAKALAYAEDASKVSHPSYKPGSNCANCQFFTAATGACSLFPGFKVPAQAWCSAWAKKAA
ncbi:high-potential iron-sulfur protein [Arenimonas fontis]|nr:high-potential iron-sulfur protein [Arenimonas fontis]